MNKEELKEIIKKDGVIVNPFYDRESSLQVMQNFPNPADRPTPHKTPNAAPLEAEKINITAQEEASILGQEPEPAKPIPVLNEPSSSIDEAHKRGNKFLEEKLRKKLEEKEDKKVQKDN